MMRFAELKIMISSGHPDVTTAVIVPLLDIKGAYQLCFGASLDAVSITLEGQRGRRVFKTLDAANKTAADLGCRYVSVFNP